MGREAYIKNQEIIRRRLEKKYIPLVEKAIQSQIDITIQVVRSKGVIAAQGHQHGDLVNTELAEAIQSLYRDAAVMALKKFLVTKAFKLPKFILDVIKFFDKYLLNKVILPITQTTIREVDRVLDESLNNGWGVDETAKRLEQTELPKWRAKLIVRTEAARATNFTQMIAADQRPFEMEKQWIAIEDKRTRKSHSHAPGVDGQRVPLYDRFSNGLLCPGDPAGSAKEVCNCRCTLGYFAVRDLEGNLIPKQKKDISLLDLLNAA